MTFFAALPLIALATFDIAMASNNVHEIAVRLPIPHQVSAMALQRASGDASVPAPVLTLQNVQLRTSEKVRIEVRAEQGGPILGSAATVAASQSASQSRTVTLSIPLSDKALSLLMNKTEITLVLRTVNSSGATRLNAEQIFFSTERLDR